MLKHVHIKYPHADTDMKAIDVSVLAQIKMSVIGGRSTYNNHTDWVNNNIPPIFWSVFLILSKFNTFFF